MSNLTLSAPSLKGQEPTFYTGEEINEAVSETLYKGLKLSELEKLKNRDEYQSYLNKCLAKLKQEAKAQNEPELFVTLERLIKEVPIWQIRDFVWPFVLSNHEGGAVLLWRVKGLVLRIECLQQGYRYTSYFVESLLAGKTRTISSARYITEVFPELYSMIVREVLSLNLDWKRRLLGEIT